MNTIRIDDVIIENKKIYVPFSVEGDVEQYFTDVKFELDYGIDLSNLPKSIAVIPFICNVLPIAWLTDSILYVSSIDRNFFESIEDFKKGYIDMYPMLKFNGKIIADDLVENEHNGNKSACFFSGGLDAYATLIAHIDESPELITLRGSDVKLDDIKGWENVSTPIIEAANEYNLIYHFITTTFRSFIDEGKLEAFVRNLKSPDGWWHGFQHGIGIIGHAAPICYLNGISKLYIASSFTPADKGKITCASDPTIDNFVRFSSTQVVHDQYEFNVQEKTKHVCDYVKETGHKVHLHVCWQSRGGKNCCRCEKCYRRLMAIIAEGGNPNDFGFDMDKSVYEYMKNDMLGHMQLKHIQHWTRIKNRFIENKDNITIREIDWIYSIPTDLYEFNNMPLKRWNRMKSKLLSKRAWIAKIKQIFHF